MTIGAGAIRRTSPTTAVHTTAAPIMARLLAHEQTAHLLGDKAEPWTNSACTQTSTQPPATARRSKVTGSFRDGVPSGLKTMAEPSLSSHSPGRTCHGPSSQQEQAHAACQRSSLSYRRRSVHPPGVRRLVGLTGRRRPSSLASFGPSDPSRLLRPGPPALRGPNPTARRSSAAPTAPDTRAE